MIETSDPLRFLNIKKKREVNKQRTDVKISMSKEPISQESSRFVLPSFSSQNSLDFDYGNKIKKAYNPLKYFNPEIQAHLTKLKQTKIANSPVMPSIIDLPKPKPKPTTAQENPKIDNAMTRTFNNQCSEMMTFAKQADFAQVQGLNQIKTSYNFFKPGLKKSGSMKMIQKLQQANQAPEILFKKDEISPWELPQNAEQCQQLEQCQICNRKFNPKSYQKHIKVCEKVFFQKRKPFNSRQNSLDKNKAPK